MLIKTIASKQSSTLSYYRGSLTAVSSSEAMTSHLFLVLACVTCASVSAYTLPSPQQPSLSDSSQDQLETFLYQLQTALEDEVRHVHL